MKPIDIRNHNFESLRGQLDAMRQAVYEAWIKHGPGTTREVSARSGIDLLTFRPRTTELCQVGLVTMTGAEAGQGIYEAVTREQWNRWRDAQTNNQLQLI